MHLGYALMPEMIANAPSSPRTAITVFIKIILKRPKHLQKIIRQRAQLFSETSGSAEGMLMSFVCGYKLMPVFQCAVEPS